MSKSACWLTPSERRAWVSLVALAQILPGTLDSHLRRAGQLTLFEFQALTVLAEAPKRTLRMSDLAEATNSSLPRLSHVVTRLARRGLVERHPCPDDGRATDVALTDAGSDAIEIVDPVHTKAARLAVFDALTPEQVEQLSSIADVVLERIDSQDRTGTPTR